jgi:hypothetical protein
VFILTHSLFSFSTTDGGQTFDNHGMADTSLGAMLSIRTAGPTWGVAGALGFIGLPCGAYTNDGTNWYSYPAEGMYVTGSFLMEQKL